MRVTVCELPDQGPDFEEAWRGLVQHCRSERPGLVLLPELPFSPWIAASLPVDESRWQEAVVLHETWLARFEELSTPSVVSGAFCLSSNRGGVDRHDLRWAGQKTEHPMR